MKSTAPSRILCSLLIATAFVTSVAGGQQADAPTDGALNKYINLDAKDTATKLEVIQHAVYQLETKLVAQEFRAEYGDRIRMKEVQFPAYDGSLIPGYVFTPIKMEKGKKYSAIVMVHGGFHERLDPKMWFPLVEAAIEKGYVVMFPEYRGSRGYGAEHFVNDYGATDVADVLASADFIAKKEFVGADRLAIFGQSRGGMVTLLAIEKAPQKFKVAVDVVGLTDFVAYMAYKPEYRRQEVAKESASFKGKLPNDNLAAYMAASPINNVDAIQTPLLVMATTGDKIAPLQLHSGRLIDALKARGKTHEVKIYDNAPGGHVFLQGDSDEQRDGTMRIFDFIGRHLKP